MQLGKHFLFGLALFLSACSAPARADVRCDTYDGDKWFSLTITDQALEKSPRWPETSETPPLSPCKAIGLAAKTQQKFLSDAGTWKIIAVELVPYRNIRGCWLWMVVFEGSPRTSKVGEDRPTDPRRFAVAVLMDGTVVEPRVSPPPRPLIRGTLGAPSKH